MQAQIKIKLDKKKVTAQPVVSNIKDCKTCVELIKSGEYNRLSIINKPLVCGPCYPAFLDHPHACGWFSLCASYQAYKHKSIDQKTFNKWLQLNCGNYYNTNSKYALSMYKYREEGLKEGHEDTEFTMMSQRIYNGLFEHEMPDFLRWYRCCKHQLVSIEFVPRSCYKHIRHNKLKFLHTMFPAATKADAKKTNISIVYIVQQFLRKGLRKQLNEVLRLFPIGTCESIITMHLINAHGNSESKLFHKLMFSDHACCLSPMGYYKYAKNIGMAVRRSGRWINGVKLTQRQVCKLSYWEMCTGRSGHVSDWEQEEKNRCESFMPLKPPLSDGEGDHSTNEQVLAMLEEEFYTIFNKIIPDINKPESWADYILKRQIWCTGGTAAGQYMMFDGEKIRLDKRAYMETLEKLEMLGWPDRPPEIIAVASEKYEIGKPRAIYGTTTMSYCISCYCTWAIEANMNKMEGLESGLTDIPELAAIMRRVRECEIAGMYTTMVDYEDFNLQHTLQAQALMFKVIGNIWATKGAHEDTVKAAYWVSEACMNQKVRFPGSKNYRQVLQGMFSGVRHTDFMNSIMNLAYYRVASRYVQSIFLQKPSALYNLHKGDDVWINNQNLIWAIALYTTMQCIGLRFQDTKQLFSENVGEFLRVRYFEGEMLGYVCRAIGALIERPLQGQDETTPPEILQGICSQIMILYRRGLYITTCNMLWDCVLEQWSAIRSKGITHRKIPRYMIEQARNYNGLDLGPPLTKAKSGTTIRKLPRMDTIRPKAAKTVPTHMTDDYAQYISEFVKDTINIESVKDAIHNANCMSVASPKDKERAISKYINGMFQWCSTSPSSAHHIRDNNTYVEYFNNLECDKPTVDYLKRQLYRCNHKEVIIERGVLSNIYKAIYSSPFKSVANAQRAFGLGVIDSVKISMAMNPLTDVANEGLTALESLLAHLDVTVVTRMVEGLTGSGIFMESELHPSVVSWAHKRAVEMAIRECTTMHIRTTTRWDEVLRQCMGRVTGAIIKEGSLVKISKY